MALKIKSVKEQLEEERRKNAVLREALERTSANLDYVAMMTDVEIEPEPDIEEVVADNE